MKVSCPHCQREYSIEGSLAGKQVKCVKCEGIFQVPVPMGSLSSPSSAPEESSPRRPVPRSPGSASAHRQHDEEFLEDFDDSDVSVSRLHRRKAEGNFFRSTGGVLLLVFLPILVLVVVGVAITVNQNKSPDDKNVFDNPFRKADQDQALAKSRVKLVEKAVESYYIDHKDYPQTLQMLLVRDREGLGPYLREKDDINDPWGQPLGFDPTAIDPISGVQRPHIFVISRQGIDSRTGEPIANFISP